MLTLQDITDTYNMLKEATQLMQQKQSERYERNENTDIQTAIQWATDLADRLNTLHPKAFNYAVWAMNKM